MPIIVKEFWDELSSHGECPVPAVYQSPSERVSAVLGPDGEPLRVGYERPKLGFDLSPKKKG
jgi:hypothetical protein